MRVLKKCLALLAVLALLLPLAPRAAAEDGDERFVGKSWEEIIEAFLDEHHADKSKVALGWCNTVSGEELYWNGDQYMVSGSMYKVPMNMIFTDRVSSGELSWDTFVGGYRYEYCLHATIVDSNNDVARGMWEYLGGYQPYRHLLAPYMGEDPDTVDEKFYENNFSTPRQMIYALKLLATEPERFPRLIDEMKQAEPSKYFKERLHDYEIAQKYGYYPDPSGSPVYLNDCAIVYTEEPVCIVIFIETRSEQSARTLLKDFCDLMIDYTEYSTPVRLEAERLAAEQAALAALATPVPEQTASPTPGDGSQSAPSETAAPVTVAPSETKTSSSGRLLPTLLGLCALAGAVYLAVLAAVRARKGKLRLGFALAAILFALAAIGICLAPQRESASAPTEEKQTVLGEAPQRSVTEFFDALCAGDFERAYGRLSGVSTLGLERAPEAEDAAAIYAALRESWAYSLHGDCVASQGGAVQQLVFTTLDVDALSAAVKTATEHKVETLAATLSPSEIYDGEGGYLASFTERAYAEALGEVLAHAEDYRTMVGLNVRLVQSKNDWLIEPDSALYAALTGGAVK